MVHHNSRVVSLLHSKHRSSQYHIICDSQLPHWNLHPTAVRTVADNYYAMVLPVHTAICDQVMLCQKRLYRAQPENGKPLVYSRHIPVELNQLQILMPPWIGSPAVRIGEAADAGLVTIVNGRRAVQPHTPASSP